MGAPGRRAGALEPNPEEMLEGAEPEHRPSRVSRRYDAAPERLESESELNLGMPEPRRALPMPRSGAAGAGAERG